MRKIKTIKLFIISIILINLISFMPNVFGLPTSWATLEDYDSFDIGDINGTGSNFDWESNDDTWRIEGVPLGDLYLENGSIDSTLYLNSTSGNYSGLGLFTKMGMTCTNSGGHNKNTNFWFNFKNETGDIVVKLKIVAHYDHYFASGNYWRLQYLDCLGSWNTIYTKTGTSSRTGYECYFGWQYYTDNILQYSIYDTSDNLLVMVNDTGLITGANFEGQHQFNCTNITLVMARDSSYHTISNEKISLICSLNAELDLPDYFYPDLNLSARCSNPIGGYSMIDEINILTGSPWWSCVLNNFIWDIADCIDGTYEIIPARYIEHQTDSFYNERIRHILLPISREQKDYVSDELTDYQLILSDPLNNTMLDCGSPDYLVPYDYEYGLVWENVNYSVNGKPVFSFSSSQTTSGFSKDYYWYGLAGFYGGIGHTRVHNEAIKFYDGQLTGTPPGNFRLTVCWYYDNSSLYDEADPNELPIIEDFDDIFGTGDMGKGYIEFYGYNSPCYYRVGGANTIPSVVFNVSGFGAGNGTKTLIYYVWRVVNGSNDEIVYYDFIEVVNRDYLRDIRELIDFNGGEGFTSSGKYYITVYNTTDYGTTATDFIHRSLTITVCPRITTGDIDEDTSTWYGLPNWTPYFIAVFIVLFITIAPLIIALYVTRNNRNKELPKIPSLVYIGFFFLGLIITTQMNLLPVWLPFVILFGMILSFVATRYLKKDDLAEGE